MKNINRPTYITHKFINAINVSKIVTMHYLEFDKNFERIGEAHDFWEAVYVDSGEVFVTAGKNTFPLKQGEVYFHKPNEYHAISANQKVPSNVFIICFVTSSKSMMYFRNKKCVLNAKLKPYIKTLLQEGFQTFDLGYSESDLNGLSLKPNPPFGSQQIIRSTLEQFLIMLVRLDDNILKTPYIFPDKESMDNHLVASVLELLDSNIYGRITVSEICKKLNYSKTYISKIFNNSCGMGIIEYYSNIKINEAKKLIRENRYSISEISQMLCFDNPRYFSRVFKKITNMTPREYSSSVKFDI